VWTRGEAVSDAEKAALVENSVKGDSDSFGKLYELHVDQVYRHIYYRVGNSVDAEDLTAQVFLNAWRAVPRYKNMGRPFQVWLLSIANNLVIDHYRARRNQTSLDDVVIASDDRDDPVAAAERAMDSEEVRDAIIKLKRDHQQVIVLRFIDGLEYPDIAAIMGKSEGAVRVIQHRALAALKGILKSERIQQ